jgi:hypothetical protein
MERYEHHKFKTPEGKKAPPSFQYQADNVMSNQATAYAELLKICNKHHVSEKCLQTSRLGPFIGMKGWKCVSSAVISSEVES